jgi:hypothetical protein
VHFITCTEYDGGSGQNGAFEINIGSENGGSAESPYDVLRFGPVDQDDLDACADSHRDTSLEEEHRVRLV